MTRPIQKKRERFFVREAARQLGKAWDLGVDRERPDFIIAEAAHKFGLEVREIFTGGQDRAGAVLKQEESLAQGLVDRFLLNYEEKVQISLIVRFVGKLCTSNMTKVVNELIKKDFETKPEGYKDRIDLGGLRIHVRKAFLGERAEWYNVNNAVGFVDHNPRKIIADAIQEKAKELEDYKKASGPDIRLLLIADHFNNSGKLTLTEPVAFDFCGFQSVYFFPFPEPVVILDRAIHAA